jgi:hypothetical protein
MKGRSAVYRFAALGGVLAGVTGCDLTAPDGTPPSVTITSPQRNDVVIHREISVSVTATDNEAVDRIELRVNGTLHDEASTPPWELAWQTETFHDGDHLLQATAVDEAGNEASDEVGVRLRDIVLVTEVQVTNTYDYDIGSRLDMEVHLFDADDGEFLACAGESTGMEIVDVSDQLYLIEASFIRPPSGSATLLYEEVALRNIALVVFDKDNAGPCPAGAIIGDDLVGISATFPGSDLASRKVMSFDNVVRLVATSGRGS